MCPDEKEYCNKSKQFLYQRKVWIKASFVPFGSVLQNLHGYDFHVGPLMVSMYVNSISRTHFTLTKGWFIICSRRKKMSTLKNNY